MAGTAVDALTDPAPIALAKADLARRTRGIPMSGRGQAAVPAASERSLMTAGGAGS
jgi:hypothetical protein